MAQATGYTCDVCGGFSIGTLNKSSIAPPEDWFTVRPRAHDEEKTHHVIDVCSNECLAMLGIERLEADGGTFKYPKVGATITADGVRKRVSKEEAIEYVKLYEDGMTLTEIAELSGRAVSTIKRAIER